MKQKNVYLLNKSCFYCDNPSFSQWHIECLRLFTKLLVDGYTKEKAIELIKEKLNQIIKQLYPLPIVEVKEEVVN